MQKQGGALKMPAKKILVTGGAVFIGSNLVDVLAPTNEVTVVDNLSTGSMANIQHHVDKGSIRFFEADILDLDKMHELTRNIDIIFHLAVQCVRVSLHDPKLVHEVDATGTLNLCMAASKNGVQKLVYTSSAEVYGDGKIIPIKEDHPLESNTPYGAAKLSGELYLGVYRRTYDLPSVVLRLFNTYGPREHFEGLYGEVIPRFVVRAMNGLSPVIFGDGVQTRSFHEVSDTVRAIVLASECDEAIGETFNIGGEEEITINNLAKTILELLGEQDRITPEHAAPRPGEILRHSADISKARKVLGFKPEFDLRDGIRNYIKWVKETHKDHEKLLEQIVFDWRGKTS
jgi:UDP-glucose 4-epimerase